MENEPIAGDDFGHTFCQDLSESDLQLDTYHDRGTEKHQEEGPSVRFSISHVSKLKYFAVRIEVLEIKQTSSLVLRDIDAFDRNKPRHFKSFMSGRDAHIVDS